MSYFPFFVPVESAPVILVGAGAQAQAELNRLLACGTTVRWFPGRVDVGAELVQAAAGRGRVEVDLRDPSTVDVQGAIAVVSAAGAQIDSAIAARARATGVPVNVVGRPDLSTFILPAIVARGDVVVAIGGADHAPVLLQQLRQRIEALLPDRLGELAIAIGRTRRPVWWRTIAARIGEAARHGRLAQVQTGRSLESPGLESERPAAKIGTVHLVGAGPGDPELLTLRALQVLQRADIVLYDDLVTPAILERARPAARRVFVGKRCGCPGIGQDAINTTMIGAARRGETVVRLKGGDAFVFGRGGEELEALRNAGVPVAIVPGITAALGCAAEAELPLTFRDEATQLSFITAHRADDAAAVNWAGLAHRQTTVVVYMGLAAAAVVREGLIAAGRDPDTPAAILARGTQPSSRAVVGTLDELGRLAATVGDGPALLVIGDVVARSAPWRDIFDLFAVKEAA